MDELTTTKPLPPARTSHLDFTALFLDGRSDATIRAYETDLRDFALFVGLAVDDAIRLLLGSGAGAANEIVLRYRAHLSERGLKASSVNRRMATLRSLVGFARTLGAVDWQLAVRGLKTEQYRDTRGPGVQGVRQMLAALKKRGGPKAIRDIAIVRLLFDCALRRGELVTLDVEHLLSDENTILVVRKGRRERERITVPEPTLAAIRAWLSIRGPEPGPLFTNLDRAKKGHRLTANGVYRMIRDLGRKIGRTVRPHGLRHAAVTQALSLTGGDVRRVARFSSHRSIQTVLIYDDARQDLGGEIAKLVAESV